MKQYRAFTLAETLMVLIVLGVFAIVSVYHLAPSKTFEEKKILTKSHTFYSTAEGVLQQILAKHSTADIVNLKDSNGDKKINSIDLRNYYKKYMEGTDLDCSNIKITTNAISDYLEAASCAEFEPDGRAAFFLDPKCESSVISYEYFTQDDNIQRTTENACGFIMYAFRGSTGALGQDLFIIPISKRQFKAN